MIGPATFEASEARMNFAFCRRVVGLSRKANSVEVAPASPQGKQGKLLVMDGKLLKAHGGEAHFV